MKIIIKEANAEKIAAAIKAAEGRATARTVTAKQVICAAERATKHLGISKKSMVGVSASVDLNAQDFPHAYKYTAESTQFDMVYTASGWAMTSVDRKATRRGSQAVLLTLTDAAREAILARASVIDALGI